MYKVIVFLFITKYHQCHILFLNMILLRLFAFMFCLHRELVAATNMVVKLYCKDVYACVFTFEPRSIPLSLSRFYNS
jgi:hypothetical protein